MKCLCLTLPEQPNRAERARKHFDEIGLNVHFVCGINGLLSGLVSSHPYEIDHPGTNYHIGPNTIGIFLSHYIAWSICAHLEDEQILIMEDDVVLCDGFKAKMNQALLDAPEDWDMMFLGSCCTGGHPTTHIKGNVFEVKWPQCLQAYILNKKAVPTLLTHYRDVYGPIDCLLKLNGFSGLRVLTVLPRLAEQLETDLPP